MQDHVNDQMADPERRFDRFKRLTGPKGLNRLQKSHIMIVGAGGVGSWAAEAVARSAVGRITIIDFDTVCIRNFNRQIQALSGTIGKPKAILLAERLRQINPEADIQGIADHLSETNCDALMAKRPDFVIDAIDHVTSKCFLIHFCQENKIPLVVSTGSGGRMDPTRIEIADLNRTEVDPLARAIRQILRAKYGFPERALYGIPAVFSAEPALKPDTDMEMTDCKAGGLCPQGDNGFQSCTKKSVVLGTASFVTGAFGLACASVAIRSLLNPKIPVSSTAPSR